MTKLVKTLCHKLALHYLSGSGQKVQLHSSLVLHNMSFMWNEISSMGFVHLFNYSTHMLYVQFISIQNLSYSPSSPSVHFCASSSLSFMGLKFWVRRSLSLFFMEFKWFRILAPKFSKTFWESAAEVVCLFYLDSENMMIMHFLKSLEIFLLHF